MVGVHAISSITSGGKSTYRLVVLDNLPFQLRGFELWPLKILKRHWLFLRRRSMSEIRMPLTGDVVKDMSGVRVDYRYTGIALCI